jgi:benzylsuccinate CoA-transferase BbsE subunit
MTNPGMGSELKETKIKAGPLSDLRVLEVADEKGLYCGKLLAELGADVIKVEDPGGDSTRRIGPFLHDIPHPERSLFFNYLNTSKRSITLDLQSSDGRALFRKLILGVDILLESFPPRNLDDLGIGYSSLSKMNPRLIMTSITGFGQTGPFSDFKSTDLIGMAMAGPMYICGFPEDPPSHIGVSQGYYLASVHASSGTLLALCHRDATGRGQHVDVSMQEAITFAQENAIGIYEQLGQIRRRSGQRHALAVPGTGLYACKDGLIVCSFHLPWRQRGGGWQPILAWLDGEGMAQDLTKPEWRDRLEAYFTSRQTMEEYLTDTNVDEDVRNERSLQKDHVNQVLQEFFSSRTKRELTESAQARRIVVAPVNEIADIVADPQLQARNFFEQVAYSETGSSLKYPRGPFLLSKTPYQIRRRAPLIGEHNIEIYEGELGLTRKELVQLRELGVM